MCKFVYELNLIKILVINILSVNYTLRTNIANYFKIIIS